MLVRIGVLVLPFRRPAKRNAILNLSFFPPPPIGRPPVPVGTSGTMSTPGTSQTVRPTAGGDGTPSPGDVLLCAFNALRDELVSTLLYLLGNRDDAQDAAQEAFLKCWRARDSLAEVQNLRAWIFRVGLNAAKDMQRSAWHRKAKPLVGEDTMLVD